MSHESYGVNENESQDNLINVYEVLEAEGLNESPIDINLSNTIPVSIARPLSWINCELPPKKMKITNTGHTVILSGKWGQERPYITNGVLSGKYVFSQMHLHWGINDMEGSEHTIDGSYYPGELHVVMFKSCYLTQESALKEKDGIVVLVYILKLQDPPNPNFEPIVMALPAIAKAHTSAKIPPVELNVLIRQFESDYFMYRGTICTSACVHSILWLITRIPIGVSTDQMDSLRYLLDNDDDIIRRNFRPIQPINDRHVFHVLPSTSKYSTLLPILGLDVEDKTVSQIYRIQLLYSRHFEYVSKKVAKGRKELEPKDFEYWRKIILEKDDNLTGRTMSVISKLNKYMDFVYYNVLYIICFFMFVVFSHKYTECDF